MARRLAAPAYHHKPRLRPRRLDQGSARVAHRPALPLSRLPELQERIDTYKGWALTRLTVMLSLHVFVRSSEPRFVRWSEFDLKRGTWDIPDTRPALEGVPFSTTGTKMAGDIHLVPLSPQAVALLEKIPALTGKFALVLTWSLLSASSLYSRVERSFTATSLPDGENCLTLSAFSFLGTPSDLVNAS